MNKERFHMLADAIEASNKGKPFVGLLDGKPEKFAFDMRTYGSKQECGTVACAAGFAFVLATGLNPGSSADANGSWTPMSGSTICSAAQRFLGLEFQQGRDLFRPEIRFMEINHRHTKVPAALRWMAETDKVDWRLAFEAIGSPIPDRAESSGYGDADQ